MTLRLNMLATLDASNVVQNGQSTQDVIDGIATSANRAGGAMGAMGNQQGMVAQSSKLAAHEMTNLSFQVNDIAVMLASGQSPFLIMAQQGMQVSQIMGPRGLRDVLGGLVAGLGSLVTPTTLALVGITALGYGAAAIFSGVRAEVLDTDAALERHGDVISDLRSAYKEASQGARDYAAQSQNALDVARFIAERNAEQLVRSIETELRAARSQLQAFEFDAPDENGMQAARLRDEFEPFADVLTRLRREITSTRPDVDGLRADIVAVMAASDDPSVVQLGNEFLALTDKASEAAGSLREVQGELIETDATMRQLINSAGVFSSALGDLGGIAANPVDPRAQAGAIYDRAVGQATTMGQIASLNDAYQGALNRIAEDEASDAAAEADRAARRSASAARRGARSAASQANRIARDLDRRTQAQAEYLQTLADTRSEIELEMRLIGSSALARAQAVAVMEAENEMRELGISLTSDQADFIRAKAAALAELRTQQDQAAEGFQLIENTGKRMISQVFDAIANRDVPGMLDAISSSLLALAQSLFVTNPLENLLYGGNAPTAASVGGAGGIWGTLLGGLFGGSASVSNAGLMAVASGIGGLFDQGDWTGAGGINEPAGIVHRQEYVVRAPYAGRYRGELEQMNKGQYRNFDQGGWSGGDGTRGSSPGAGERGFTLIINDNAGVSTRGERRKDDQGGDVFELALDRMDGEMADGRFDGAMGRYGAKPRGVARG
ncbi:MAG: phage tail length tape measure family protein [Pseudomonadota bacterium]